MTADAVAQLTNPDALFILSPGDGMGEFLRAARVIRPQQAKWFPDRILDQPALLFSAEDERGVSTDVILSSRLNLSIEDQWSYGQMAGVVVHLSHDRGSREVCGHRFLAVGIAVLHRPEDRRFAISG
ncbi:MAG: hypothetical protein KF910_05045 [Brevundimonas sp.]|uniref:hypothetical protein n=1 Tax=Brevundimonas sp. TaxID=1871086 RepID=UPI0025B9DA43|nr:hypothetical protein [Brevundimonas sp.]MBX3476950.1 hypothetical protein [Brevundimonas sp.]